MQIDGVNWFEQNTRMRLVLPGTEGQVCEPEDPTEMVEFTASTEIHPIENIPIRADGEIPAAAIGPFACRQCPAKCDNAYSAFTAYEASSFLKVGYTLDGAPVRLGSSAAFAIENTPPSTTTLTTKGGSSSTPIRNLADELARDEVSLVFVDMDERIRIQRKSLT